MTGPTLFRRLRGEGSALKSLMYPPFKHLLLPLQNYPRERRAPSQYDFSNTAMTTCQLLRCANLDPPNKPGLFRKLFGDISDHESEV